MLVELGLDTALLVSDARPNDKMLDWFALHRNATLSLEFKPSLEWLLSIS